VRFFFSISIPQSVECLTEQKIKPLSLLYGIVVSIYRTSFSFLYAIFYIKWKVEEPQPCLLYLKFISIFFFY